MQPQQLFPLPYERGLQLRQIAETKQTTPSVLLLGLIKQAIADGIISPDIPEFHIAHVKSDDAFLIGFGDDPKEKMSREIAEQLSDAIFSAATSQDKFQDMQIDRHFVVSRKTSGVRVTIPANGMTRSYNRDLAIDIAKQIDRAIDAIEDQQE